MIYKQLDGKRVAIVGFDPGDAARIATALDNARAFSRAVGAESLASPAELDPFDLIVAPLAIAGNQLGTDRRRSTRPLLLIGTPAEFAPRIASLRSRNTDYLLDSWSPEELCLRVAALVAGAPVIAARRNPLIVAADDDSTIRALVSSVLISDGMTCETASNGGEALEKARALKPDLLVLDVNMPQLSGFEVLTAVKQDPSIAFMRVILLTGAEQESDIMRGFTLGAADYVVKPFNPMELLVRIRRFVRRG